MTQSSVSVVQDNKTLSRQRKILSPQQIHATVRNSVATKEISVATKVEKNHKRMSQYSTECCNKVEELEEETSVATKDEEERIEDLSRQRNLGRDRIQNNRK